MGFRRDVVLFSGLIACGLAFSAIADDMPDTLGLGAPEPPAALRLGIVADTASLSPAPALAAPDLPAPVVVPAEPAVTAAMRSVVVAPLPDAPVVMTPDDLVQGAIVARLAEPGSIWPNRLPKKDRDALLAFYETRAGAPLWTDGAGWARRSRPIAERLDAADAVGLDAAEYPLPALPPGRPATPAEIAEGELKLSALAALYARDARGGRIDPTRLSSLLTPKLDLPTADAALASLAAADDPGAALEAYNPPHPGFLALKAKLAALRANLPAIPMARRRPGQDLTTQTIAAVDAAPRLAAVSPRLEGDLVANMERWRWLPADLGARYVAVNVPEFRLRLIENAQVVHETRVITGRPETPTPIFSGLMDHAVVNPSWYIPPSIMKKEILPGLAADPDYAAKRGYEVVRRRGQISVRQPPGERNALGFIKFMFPNGHAVYLHDTPNRSLFTSARRAFSHGCVRVENPFALADFVLGHDWTEARLKRLIGRGERTIFLPAKLPVHLTYFTVDVDASGDVRSFEDLYGFNRRVRQALGLGA